MSPVIKRPAAKKPAGRKPIKMVQKKAARPVPAPARKPVSKIVAKKAPAPKPRVAKAAKPALPRAAKPAPSLTAAQAKVMVQQFSLAGKTNQDIINVIYKAADELKIPAWSLLSKVKLEHLVDARSAPYTGPAISALPGLTNEERAVIQKVLTVYDRPGK